VVYKSGGSSGETVATLTLTYDGNSNLTSVTKS
jgi:YD repeat-containing protein